jgi:hypothetical protein
MTVVEESAESVCAGLFGENRGILKGIHLTDVYVSASTSASYAYAGGLAGYNGDGAIVGCTVSGRVFSSSTSPAIYSYYPYAGGLIGYNSDGVIEDCTVNCQVSSYSATNYSSYAGGLIGYNTNGITYYGRIKNCAVSGSVSASAPTAPTYAGGFIGYNSGGGRDGGGGSIESCTATCDVSASSSDSRTSYVGGFVGYSRRGIINLCAASGSYISAACRSVYRGGFIGTLDYNTTAITNSHNETGLKPDIGHSYRTGGPINDMNG